MTRQPSSAEAVSQPVVAANGTTVVNENTGEKFKGTAVLGDEQLAVPPLRFPLKAVRLNLPFPAVWSMAMMGQ